MAFKSPAPHRYSRGNLGTKLTKGGKPNKYTPHTGSKEKLKANQRRLMEILQAQRDDEERFQRGE